MENKYLTPEKHLILRIIEQWGNAATMGEMEQWLKDYANLTKEPFVNALRMIEKMSDPGGYYKAVCDMKAIATNALSGDESADIFNPELLQVIRDAEKSKEDDLKAVKEVIGGAAVGITQDAHEKEVMMQAFDKVRQIFVGRQWIMEGRGSYPYNDDRYQQEVRYMYDEFDQVVKDTWANIKSKSADYRKAIIAEYLESAAGWEEDAVKGRDMFTFIQWCFNEHPGMITNEHDEWYLSDSTFPELYELFKQQKEK